MKLLTFDGPKGHLFEVPGFFTIAAGDSHEIDEHVAEAVVRANPKVPLMITDLPKKRGHKADAEAESQPEAQQGEGQPTATDPQEE